MWFKNACVIKRIQIKNPDLVKSDPDVATFIEKAPESLGRKGRFVIKLSGIQQENSVLAEGKRKKVCNQCIEKLLIQKGYMNHEHAWEILKKRTTEKWITILTAEV